MIICFVRSKQDDDAIYFYERVLYSKSPMNEGIESYVCFLKEEKNSLNLKKRR